LEKANEIFLPYIVIGELYYGSLKSKLKKRNIQRIEEFIQSAPVIIPNIDTARVYGHIKHRLSKKGKPIPENDVWIAALAKQHGMILVTYDRHFEYIDGISLKFFHL